ncbi:NADH-quinone oxidoreductase subunit NuoK [Acidithiobacillus sp. M4-SHS-6]|uniref:NADH-quinone oxidoreductase subunit NuoK n=1 Tax=Acidithiobacillus sp. M4-SHS-6 TaxID=3383024 RepID=UPI0039BDA84E
MTLELALVIAALLFVVGVALILLRRNLIFLLLGIELLFNAAMVIALAGGARWHSATGQVLVVFMMALSGAALALTLALLLRVKHDLGGDTVDDLRQLREEADE